MTQGGIRTVEELEKLEKERRAGKDEDVYSEKKGFRGRKKRKVRAVPKGTASNEMCTFLILNISSLQLIPVNMIAYRSQYGSVNPAAIVAANTICVKKSALIRIVWYNV